MLFKSMLGTVSVLLSIVSFNANAALVERLGGLAYYDDVADLTWLADANYAYTSGYWTDSIAGMNWDQANAWAAQLDIDGVSGADGWRLPDIDPLCSPGTPCTTSEMGNLFHDVLGNQGALTNTSPFSNVQNSLYWQAQDVATLYGYTFDMWNGQQGSSIEKDSGGSYAWAVYTGDISAVPVPAAVWLFGSGLIGLAGFARRRKA